MIAALLNGAVLPSKVFGAEARELDEITDQMGLIEESAVHGAS
jgi:hypothetical protein